MPFISALPLFNRRLLTHSLWPNNLLGYTPLGMAGIPASGKGGGIKGNEWQRRATKGNEGREGQYASHSHPLDRFEFGFIDACMYLYRSRTREVPVFSAIMDVDVDGCFGFGSGWPMNDGM